MDEQSAFDARPDRELGALLREALAAGSDDALIARIVAGYDVTRIAPRPFVEVLAGWARAGAVAAAVAATLALYFAMPHTSPVPVPTLLEAALPESPASAAALVSSTRPPDPNVVFASAFEP